MRPPLRGCPSEQDGDPCPSGSRFPAAVPGAGLFCPSGHLHQAPQVAATGPPPPAVGQAMPGVWV